MESTETVKINLSKDQKDAMIFEARRAYRDGITLEDAVLNILEEWLTEIEVRPILDEEPYEEPIMDAATLLEEHEEFFELAPVLGTSVLDPDFEINWLHWNGNVLENVVKARAQVMHILEPKDYPALGKKIFENILNIVEYSKEANL